MKRGTTLVGALGGVDAVLTGFDHLSRRGHLIIPIKLMNGLLGLLRRKFRFGLRLEILKKAKKLV